MHATYSLFRCDVTSLTSDLYLSIFENVSPTAVFMLVIYRID